MEKVVKKRTFRCLAGISDFRKKIMKHIDGKEWKYKIVFIGEKPKFRGWECDDTIYCGNPHYLWRFDDYMYSWNNYNNSFDVQLVRIKD